MLYRSKTRAPPQGVDCVPMVWVDVKIGLWDVPGDGDRIVGSECFFDVSNSYRRLVDALLEGVDAVDQLEVGVTKS